MTGASLLRRYEMLRYSVFRRRYSLSLTGKVMLALGMASLTGALAQLRIVLPWTPVPITGQTFAILLAGIFLGRRWGGVSQAIYVGLGMAGVPWFAGQQCGIGAIAGPTGGYLVGFILAALLIGYLTDRYVGARNFLPILGIMLLANFGLIHALGLLHLGLWFKVSGGAVPSIGKLLNLGVLPFVPGDLAKVLAAATAGYVLLPRQDWRQV